MPSTAISVKDDWVPVEDLLTLLPELESLENIRQQYTLAQAR